MINLQPSKMADTKKPFFTFLFSIAVIVAVTAAACLYYLRFEQTARESTESTGEKMRPKKPENVIQEIGFQSPAERERWKVHHFTPAATAEILPDESGGYVMDIKSKNDGSLFLTEANIPMKEHPRLTWEWRVLEFPSGKTNDEFSNKQNGDFGARVLVVFKGLTRLTSETVHYVWDDHFPAGTHRSMPFFKHIKMLVVRKTDTSERGWFKEERDITADYEMLFGKKPKNSIQAIGLMTDSDNTGTSAHAQYRNIKLIVPSNPPAELVPERSLEESNFLSRLRGMFSFERGKDVLLGIGQASADVMQEAKEKISLK